MIIDCYYFAVLISVCRSRVLMPAVQSGDVMKVDAILNFEPSAKPAPHETLRLVHTYEGSAL